MDVEALTVEARADAIAEAQRGWTDARDEATIRDLFLATRGEDLTRLKNLCDEGDDHRDLLHLVYSDIDDDAIRDSILLHFEREAEALPRPRALKVLSDIDDTVCANWKDRRFPEKTVYPGVIQLYEALDLGPGDDDRTGDLTFVTARPRDRMGHIERATHASLRRYGLTSATVLSGSFKNLLGNRSIANKKLDNFLRYVTLFPEYDFVFIGDSGQGDAVFGARMREHEPERVRAVLIHDVVGTPAEARAVHAGRGVTFFDTYVGAALEAHRLGLISRAGLSRVMTEAERSLGELRFEDEAQRAARLEELAQDLTWARGILDML